MNLQDDLVKTWYFKLPFLERCVYSPKQPLFISVQRFLHF